MPLFLFSFALHAYAAWRLMPALLHLPSIAALLGIFLLASSVLMPLSLTRRRMPSPIWSDRLAWAGFLCMGMFSSLLVLTLLRDLVLLSAWAASSMWPTTIDLSALARESAFGVVAAAVALTLWGLVNARSTARVVSIDVPIANLPPALAGFKIAQITDLHVGATIKRGYVKRIVDKVNRLEPDMVAITGDLVDGSVASLRAHVAPLGELASRHGTYFVTGNHEYYSGAHAWINELRRLGMIVLLNQHVVLKHDDASLVVAGIADHSAHRLDATHASDAGKALAGAPSELVKIMLAHQPRSAPASASAGAQLQLSGHTHGGQFWPWNLFVPLQQPFTAGLHRLRDLLIYVSRGTGYWGPPTRFGAPSEITNLRLVAA